MTQNYGYVPYYRPPKAPTLAQAAGSGTDPFGISGRSSVAGGVLGLGASRGFAAPSHATPPVAHQPAQNTNSSLVNAVARLGIGGIGQNGQQQQGAAAVNRYDLNTDPALQQIQALIGMSDEQAQAQALKERQNLLLQYGDPDVAASVLGANDPFVQAVGDNPTSTVKQLGQQRTRNLKDLLEQLNQSNLAYGGYRIDQEQQAQNDYQNALAQAAGGLNSNLDQVSGSLSQAMSANQAQLAQATADAAARAAANGDTGAPPPDPAPAPDPGAPPIASGGGAGIGIPQLLQGGGPNGGGGAVPFNPSGVTGSALLRAIMGSRLAPRP